MGEVLSFPQRPAGDGDPWEAWIDEAALARHLGVSTRSVRRWRESGMPSKLWMGSRRYRITQCEHWLEAKAS